MRTRTTSKFHRIVSIAAECIQNLHTPIARSLLILQDVTSASCSHRGDAKHTAYALQVVSRKRGYKASSIDLLCLYLVSVAAQMTQHADVPVESAQPAAAQLPLPAVFLAHAAVALVQQASV